MRRTLSTLLTLLNTASAALAAPPVTFTSLLDEMINRDSLARFPDPAYTCKQFSSYDQASNDPANEQTWFANGDANQYLRTETNSGRKEWVMMDTAGPGAVVRIWSANPKGVMRIYLDGADKPAIEGKMSDLLGGHWEAASPLSYEASKGWNCYLPVPYASHCKITCDADGFYYHVNYRTYAAGTAVESFKPSMLKDNAGELKHVIDEMKVVRTEGQPIFSAGEKGHMQTGKAGPGEKVTLTLPPGSNAITGMMLTIKSPNDAQASRSCVITGTFDGEEDIWCPVGDFFGSGVGFNSYQDWYRAVGKDGMMRCRWVMPYEKSGSITIENLGLSTVEVNLGLRIKPWTWDSRSMHFHAVWRDEYPIHALGGKGTSDFNYVDVKGKGVYVGDVLSVMNPVKDWWGEGDEKIYVDGEKFPSHFGTGTEDYYGYAWCWPAFFNKPFHAQPRVDGESLQNNWGRTTVTRSRSLDAIPFNTALSMNIEVWHWKECNVEYATTAYFYATPGATHNRKPSPESAAKKLIEPPPLPPPFKIKNALEAETLKVVNKSDGLIVIPQGDFPPDLWSGQRQLWIQGRKPGDFIELKIPATSKSKVILYATKSWDYGIVRFTVNGAKAGNDTDLCSLKKEVLATGPIDLGAFEPKDGGFTLRAEVVGSNPKSEATKSFFGIDCIVLEPAK